MFEDLIDETHRKPRKLNRTPAGKLTNKVTVVVGTLILGLAALGYNSVFTRYVKSKYNPMMTSEELMYQDAPRYDFLTQAAIRTVVQRQQIKEEAALDTEVED